MNRMYTLGYSSCNVVVQTVTMTQFHVLSHLLSSHNYYKSGHPIWLCHSKYCPLHVFKAQLQIMTIFSEGDAKDDQP